MSDFEFDKETNEVETANNLYTLVGEEMSDDEKED